MNRIMALAAATALFFTAVSGALGQQTRAPNDRDRPTVSRLTAYDDARIARLKADLRLAQDQESEWNKLEVAVKEISKDRAERFVAWWEEREKRNADTLAPQFGDALRQRADAMAKHAADLRKLADASDPLLGKLDDAQKRRTAEFIMAYSTSPLQVLEPRRRSTRWQSWIW
jgi:hypothetical protein